MNIKEECQIKYDKFNNLNNVHLSVGLLKFEDFCFLVTFVFWIIFFLYSNAEILWQQSC